MWRNRQTIELKNIVLHRFVQLFICEENMYTYSREIRLVRKPGKNSFLGLITVR